MVNTYKKLLMYISLLKDERVKKGRLVNFNNTLWKELRMLVDAAHMACWSLVNSLCDVHLWSTVNEAIEKYAFTWVIWIQEDNMSFFFYYMLNDNI